MTGRYFTSLPAPDSHRCKAEVKAAHGNPDGRCVRWKKIGDYCLQHHRAQHESSGGTERRHLAVRMTKEQRAWCKRYKKETTFEPLMDDFLAGNETFLQAAKASVRWFEDWSSDAHLNISRDIPGADAELEQSVIRSPDIGEARR